MKEDRRGKRRTEKAGTRERGKEKEEVMCYTQGRGRSWRRTETIIALSYHYTVINSLLVRESAPRLGPSLMTNHLHPALQPWLFMIRQLVRVDLGASWARIGLGPVSSLLGPMTTSNGATLSRPISHSSSLHADSPLSTSSSGYC